MYKPLGVTSAHVVAIIKATLLSEQSAPGFRRSRQLKVGHGGTLDKCAEGVLVVGVGEDCKKLGFFQNKSIKSYKVTGCLGVTTDTLDRDGVITERRDCSHINHDTLTRALQGFHGVITQTPPLYSALKHQGKRLSDHVREAQTTGVTLHLPSKARQVTIKSISLQDYNSPSFSLTVTCSSGTYVRSLIRDVAESLNTVGYMTHLVRTSVGPFTLQHALRQDQDGHWTLDSIHSAVNNSQSLFS